MWAVLQAIPKHEGLNLSNSFTRLMGSSLTLVTFLLSDIKSGTGTESTIISGNSSSFLAPNSLAALSTKSFKSRAEACGPIPPKIHITDCCTTCLFMFFATKKLAGWRVLFMNKVQQNNQPNG